MVTPVGKLHWHNALQHLYYLPIVFAGLSFGWAGGLGAALLAALSNAPHNWVTWSTANDYAVDHLWEIPWFWPREWLRAGLAGGGARHAPEAGRTRGRRTGGYRKLQENFGRLKRAGGL